MESKWINFFFRFFLVIKTPLEKNVNDFVDPKGENPAQRRKTPNMRKKSITTGQLYPPFKHSFGLAFRQLNAWKIPTNWRVFLASGRVQNILVCTGVKNKCKDFNQKTGSIFNKTLYNDLINHLFNNFKAPVKTGSNPFQGMIWWPILGIGPERNGSR